MQKNISTNQMCAIIFILFLGNKLLVLPSILYYLGKNDALLFLLVNSVLDILLVMLFIYVNKKSKTHDLYEQIQKQCGVFIAKIFAFIFIAYFLLKSYLLLCETEHFLFTTIYTTLKAEWFILPTIIVCLYIVSKGTNNVARTVEVFSFIIFIGVFISFLIAMQNVHFDGFLPIGVASSNQWLDMFVKSSMWFGNYFIMFFLIGKVKTKGGEAKKIIIASIVSAIIVFCLFAIFYCIFEQSSIVHYYAISDIVSFTPTLSSLAKFDWFTVMFYGFTIVLQLVLYLYVIVQLCEHVVEKKLNFYFYLLFALMLIVAYVCLSFGLDYVIDFFVNQVGVYATILNIFIPFFVLLLYSTKLKATKRYHKK